MLSVNLCNFCRVLKKQRIKILVVETQHGKSENSPDTSRGKKYNITDKTTFNLCALMRMH